MLNMRPMNRLAALLLVAAVAGACGPPIPKDQIRGYSEGLSITVTADSLPPRAMDDIVWRVTVRDSKTGLPIEGGQGSVWARSRDGHETSSGLVPAKELGTYTTPLRLIMAAPWQMGVQFRRDSTSVFASISWIQEVLAPRPLGG
jgi:hypothetical protein